jgi:Icc-related predicted phosphoesterase
MSLILRVTSDLHTEFSPWKPIHLSEDTDSVLVLAGDIGVVNHDRTLERIVDLLRHASSEFRAVVYVMGNHEFYNAGHLTKSRAQLLDIIAANKWENVYLLENETVVINDIAFIGATMWTDYDNKPSNYWLATRYMADYSNIRITIGDETIDEETGCSEAITRCVMPEDLHAIHLESRRYIFEQIKKHRDAGLKTVVVTHHGPTRQSTHPRFMHDRSNFNFVSELTGQIIDANPNLWIHGHVHDAMDYMVDEEFCQTRVIANPKGYPNESRGTSDDPCLQIEI